MGEVLDTVWLVYEGEYEQTRVVSAHTTEKAANAYAEAVGGYVDHFMLKYDMPPTVPFYEYHLAKDGKTVEFEQSTVLGGEANSCRMEARSSCGSKSLLVQSTVGAKHAEALLKLAQEALR